jgi:small subunit ribosomal protein S16
MALKIRLRQQGRNNRPFYRLVVADVRSPRDGKYLEALGWYNPFEAEADRSFSANAER